jgi:hypothetical protein
VIDLSDIERSLGDLREAVEAQTAGLMHLAGGLANQTAMLKTQSAMLTEVRDMLTTEPAEESPLVKTLRELAAAIGEQSSALARIETAVGDGPA